MPFQKEVDVILKTKEGCGVEEACLCVVWCGAEREKRLWVGFAEQPLPSSVSLFTLARPDPLPTRLGGGDSPMAGNRREGWTVRNGARDGKG